MLTTRVIQVASSAFVAFLAPFLVAPPSVSAGVGVVAFGALFVFVVWTNVVTPQAGRSPFAMLALAAAGVATQPFFGLSWLLTASFMVTSAALLCEPKRRWPLWFAGVAGADVATGLLLGLGAGRAFLVAALLAGYGLLVGGFYWVAGLSTQLRSARADLARGAIAAERLRIARDLHDVLGQRLTEVVLTSEVAARQAGVDPAAAAEGMRAVGGIARGLLNEVRSTVSGYREVTLDSEVATAREVTRAGRVALAVELPDPAPGGLTGVTLAWMVREGVTNVMRHARARSCTITVTGGDTVTATIVDDGPGHRRPVSFGTGLTGLAERVAAAGGTLRAEAGEHRFTLRAEFPGLAP